MDLREHVCYPSLDGDLSNEHLNRQKKKRSMYYYLIKQKRHAGDSERVLQVVV